MFAIVAVLSCGPWESWFDLICCRSVQGPKASTGKNSRSERLFKPVAISVGITNLLSVVSKGALLFRLWSHIHNALYSP